MKYTLTESQELELRERCVERAVEHHSCDTPAKFIVETASAFYDFITGSKDAAVLAAAKELAKAVNGSACDHSHTATDGPFTHTATGHPLTSRE